MKPILTCAIVRDLLPLYVEHLIEPETDEAVKAHLDECPECSKHYEAMTNVDGTGAETGSFPQTNAPEIDYLKSVKKHNVRNIILSIVIVATLLVGAAGLKLFVIGFPLPNGLDGGVYATAEDTSFGGKQTVQVRLMSTTSLWEIRHIDVEINNGVATITARNTLPLPIREYNRSTDIGIDVSQNDIHTIEAFGEVIWQDGVIIDPYTNRLYELKTPYIGNASSTFDLIGNMNLGMLFDIELQTETEPYGVTIHFSETWDPKHYYKIEDSAYLILALIDNLGYVSWDDPSGYSDSLSVEEVNEALPGLIYNCNKTHGTDYSVFSDIKSFSNPAELQELITILEI